MTNKSRISEDEKRLFRDAVKDVTRVFVPKRKRHRALKRRVPEKSTHPKIQDYPLSMSDINEDQENWLRSDDLLHFSRTGVRQKILHRLKRGKLSIEAQLDLHRMTSQEAFYQVNEFINDCVEKQINCICLIHGKGYNSPSSKPIIKNRLNHWLIKNPLVLAFHSAKPLHGGTGAVYVLLKSKKT